MVVAKLPTSPKELFPFILLEQSKRMPAFPQPYGKLYHQTPGFVPIRQVLLMWIFPIMMNFKYLSLLRAICISCPVKCLFKFLIHFWGIVHPCVLASHFLGALQTLGRLVFCLWYMWKYFQESFNFLSVFFFFATQKLLIPASSLALV